ncbi:MAG: hypothetical protein AB2672_17840 [Candidatus Thiodiazotropha endolucinida]|nr:hypothetical protein [Candidatus Thiodiazotropha taylori]MCG8023834.1 hypothetical protein [Candidatus Thiodiazotropha endolucinida]MCG7881724.1 hypothetical protein [Candidatus Thiodiazotropha taylori]MCG7885609.1 hypothetical protein [Candidatus Thiodiazotropha taylori]MCG7889614.1 hypothetical protein [Candidatus Thiodiazotropha taylori]
MTNQTPYSGPERRIEQRRKIVDRRELIRFEPDKEPRRKGHGRRKGEMNDPWNRLGNIEKRGLT